MANSNSAAQPVIADIDALLQHFETLRSVVQDKAGIDCMLEFRIQLTRQFGKTLLKAESFQLMLVEKWLGMVRLGPDK